jgi:hypothetical protein
MDIGIELTEQYLALEEKVKQALISAIAESDVTSKTHQNQVIPVNVFGYTELGVINGELTFLDDNGYQYGLYTDGSLEDLIDILVQLED